MLLSEALLLPRIWQASEVSFRSHASRDAVRAGRLLLAKPKVTAMLLLWSFLTVFSVFSLCLIFLCFLGSPQR